VSAYICVKCGTDVGEGMGKPTRAKLWERLCIHIWLDHPEDIKDGKISTEWANESGEGLDVR